MTTGSTPLLRPGRRIRSRTGPAGPDGQVSSWTLTMGLPTGADCARSRKERASAGESVWIGGSPARDSANCCVTGSSAA